MTNTSGGSHLTASRISRLFRSLRAKCANLATFSPPSQPRPTVSVTYSQVNRPSSRRIYSDDSFPPLAVLPTPERLGSRAHLDRACIENMQLSKRIYEVRDAFRNVLQATSGAPHVSEGPQVAQVPSLAGLCAKIVGEHIQSELDAYEPEEDDDADAEDVWKAEIMDKIYEYVPPHYRHFTVVSHALSLILETCPHYPTLLTVLLDVCLSYSLPLESHTVLHTLFSAALRPTNDSTLPCALAHPAHSNYLTALRSTYCANAALNERTFTRIFVDVLTEPGPGRIDAWTSKTTTRLARELRSHDFSGAFLQMCSGLAHMIAHSDQPRLRPKAKRKGKEVAQPSDNRLRSRLAKWVKSITQRLHANAEDLEDAEPDVREEFQAVVGFLIYVDSLELHLTREEVAMSELCLVDALICLATSCLSSPVMPVCDVPALQNFLRRAKANSESYKSLLELVFVPPPLCPLFGPGTSNPLDNTPTPPPSDIPSYREGMHALHVFASSLHAQSLARLEALLWTSALRHVEDLSVMTPVSLREIEGIRMELVDLSEAAERRCFGGHTTHERDGGSSHSTPVASSSQHGTESEWEWADMVGCWVLKSPRRESVSQGPPKKRKLERAAHGRGADNEEREVRTHRSRSQMQHSTSVHSSRASSRGTEGERSTHPKPASDSDERQSTRTSFVPSKRRSAHGDAGDDTADEENVAPCDSVSSVGVKFPTRRLSNFATILSDAQMNIIVLHPKGRPSELKRQRLSSLTADDPAEEVPPHRLSLHVDSSPERPSRGVCSVNQLSSDDALDLFAYTGSSSPVVVRKVQSKTMY
ncbi:hypothetical protein A0H81_11771 [Grifola frondosa]|uniref:Uncharacterized protein n=1 Tax=Grifola frondosa TaxID=5627 RepID=A0A1C7LUL1_GRIFR|nr:hypothetical protein A0H81_11771 [Grifola frondosa]